MVFRRLPLTCALLASLFLPGRADDWPMWRCDAGRTGTTREELSTQRSLAWVRTLPPSSTAWKDEQELMFDKIPLPVAAGGLVYLGSTVNDTVTAYDLATGVERWRFCTEGPIRVAPAVWKDRLFVGSDDGFLYCLAAATGELLWKVRGGPHERRLIGNERLIATWPVRGGPVVADDTVYFAAGVWPFMGVFVHACDCATGKPRWVSDGVSFVWRTLPHPGAAGFSGLAPQGHLAVAGNRLIVPGSRGKPFVFDRATGEFLFVAEGVSPQVCAQGDLGFAGGQTFELAKGRAVKLAGFTFNAPPLLGDERWYAGSGVFLPSSVDVDDVLVSKPEATPKVFELRSPLTKSGTLPASPLLEAGALVLCPITHGVALVDPARKPREQLRWEGAVDGVPLAAIAANQHLIVVTADTLCCFAPNAKETMRHQRPPAPPLPSATPSDRGSALRAATNVRDGYCMVLGLEDGSLVAELVRTSALHVVAVDADAARVAALRRSLDAQGLYGTRAAAIHADPCEIVLVPYLASLVVSENAERAGVSKGRAFVEHVFNMLRPYGGVACLALDAAQRASVAAAVEDAKLPGAALSTKDSFTLLAREGALPGAADWSGQNADPGNTRVSRDRLVKAPLGVLWFGNSLSNSLVLPRHGEGPLEQIVGGRLFIEGAHSLSAACVYTGRFLWTREFPDIGAYYGKTLHQRGAHVLGSNFFAVEDAVYVAAGLECHALDPVDGRTLRTFSLPRAEFDAPPSPFLFLLVYEDLLLAGAEPSFGPEDPAAQVLLYNSMASSKRLVAFDRRTGAVRWLYEATESLPHFGIAAGNGKVFCIDRLSVERAKALARRGLKPQTLPRVLALDARDGKTLWSIEREVGEVLTYSATHDILLADAALSGADGTVRWQLSKDAAPLHDGKWGPLVGERTIITQLGRIIDIATGAIRETVGESGKTLPWRIRRSYGCGPLAGSEHLITFRSGCAGFFDLAHDGGTANLGGFRSGCTPNLLAAGGVLCAPDYTRTCICRYQNRASLGLIHMPEAEYWTFGMEFDRGRMGFNFGAPGDRRAPDGTLWRAVPCPYDTKYGGKVLAVTDPATPTYFVHHASRLRDGEGWKWVGASGVRGVRTLSLPLTARAPRTPFTLKLYFAEPDHAEAGKRVFSIRIGERRLLEDFDIANEAGGAARTVVRTFGGLVLEGGELTLTFEAAEGEALICGVEVVQE